MRRNIHRRGRALLLAGCAGALALLAAPHARAACTINATSAVAFGIYDPSAAAPNDSTGTITYTCFSAGTTIRIAAAGTNVVLNVFGRIPAAQNPNPGSYSDTIVVTFFF